MEQYNYSIQIPSINWNNINKPYIYRQLDILHKLNTETKDESEKKTQLKIKIREIYNYILKVPMILIERFNIFTPFIYAMYCHQNVIEILYNIFNSLPKEIRKNFLIKPWDYTSSIYNFTPLHFAVYSNLKNMVLFLSKIGANSNEVDKYGNSPLHLSCIFKRNEILDVLIFYKNIEINLLNFLGESPLYICIKSSYVYGVKRILENGGKTMYKFQKKIIDLHNIVMSETDSDDIKGLFIEKQVAQKRREKITKSFYKQALKNKILLKEHSQLCSDLNGVTNMNTLYNLASYVGIKSPVDFNKDDLCKKIATKMMIKSYSKQFL